MESATWLRIAAGLTAFQTVGHTFGAVLASPSSSEESALRQTMGAFQVSVMGMERSYWDFYLGSGWAITALAATIAVVIWLLAPIARQSPPAARPMILALAAGYAVLTVISALYFVTAPIVIGAMITGCLVMAAMVARPSAAAVTLLLAVALMACAYDAAKARKGFWTFKQEPGMDSMLLQGLLGTMDGTIYQFWYDSAPCGGPGCGGRFSVSRCNYPTVLVHQSKRTDFGCDDVKRQIPIANPQS